MFKSLITAALFAIAVIGGATSASADFLCPDGQGGVIQSTVKVRFAEASMNGICKAQVEEYKAEGANLISREDFALEIKKCQLRRGTLCYWLLEYKKLLPSKAVVSTPPAPKATSVVAEAKAKAPHKAPPRRREVAVATAPADPKATAKAEPSGVYLP
jgi:hypothetical protein